MHHTAPGCCYNGAPAAAQPLRVGVAHELAAAVTLELLVGEKLLRAAHDLVQDPPDGAHLQQQHQPPSHNEIRRA
jgi:hypothetical protein